MSLLIPKTFLEIKQCIDAVIISRRNTDTGLFPASTAKNEHGDYSDAWVRDNLYTLVSVFGLYQHLRKNSQGQDEAAHYGGLVTQTMRGLLLAMMRQGDKVERFKYSHHPMDALHAKYDTDTGQVVVGDDQWGHLQIDATSLFLLSLAQMHQAGLNIVQNADERDFVQNLIYYIAQGYQIPDFGIWERGNKINNGARELHASSVGMVKSALVAMSSTPFHLLGDEHPHYFYVNEDEIARCRMTLEQLLPRESLSKEVDAACLSIVGYPAFAVESDALMKRTTQKIRQNLLGHYGSKRFLLDGHQTPVEDKHRLHYNDQELKSFEDIECEWPLFLCYEFVTALMLQDATVADDYSRRIEKILVQQEGYALLPELYQLDLAQLPAEKEQPGSQPRHPNANVPLVWAQSLFYLGLLLEGGWVTSDDIDPVGLYKPVADKRHNQVNVVVIAETAEVQEVLATLGVESETLQDIAPLRLISAHTFSKLHQDVGANVSCQWTGAPDGLPRPLQTARAYRYQDSLCLVQSNIQSEDSYLSNDVLLMVESLRADWHYIARHWHRAETPLSVVWVTASQVAPRNQGVLADFVAALQDAKDSHILLKPVSAAQAVAQTVTETIAACGHPLKTIAATPSSTQWRLPFSLEESQPQPESLLSFLEPPKTDEVLTADLCRSANIYGQLAAAEQLMITHSIDHRVTLGTESETLGNLIEEIYQRASENNLWSVVRKAAAILGRYFNGLETAVAEILARQKMLFAGRSFDAMGRISEPLPQAALVDILQKNTGYDPREGVINQEIIICLAMTLRLDPQAFKGILTLRSGQILQLMLARIAKNKDLGAPEAFDALCNLSPSQIQRQVRRVVLNYDHYSQNLIASEGLKVHANPISNGHDFSALKALEADLLRLDDASDWLHWREVQGLMPRLSESYYLGLWHLLERSRGLVLGNRFDRKTRMDSAIVLGSMTQGEGQFVHLFEAMLNQIQSPSYRQMTIEALYGMMQFMIWNTDMAFHSYLTIEIILGHAVRINWLQHHPEDAERYNDMRGKAWRQFYLEHPDRVTERVGEAMAFLVATGQDHGLDDEDDISSVH